jgi:hypothetical protein
MHRYIDFTRFNEDECLVFRTVLWLTEPCANIHHANTMRSAQTKLRSMKLMSIKCTSEHPMVHKQHNGH